MRPKRKASSGKARATSQSGDEDGYDDGHEPPTKLNKKRRLNKNLNPLQSKILERITELEGAVHELQSRTVREVERINQLIGRLKADVHELDPAD